MNLIPLKISGAFRIALDRHDDLRGFFFRSYDEDFFKQQGLSSHWIQESHSFSKKKGTVRGLHFQCTPHGETKLVRPVGDVFMVIVDLRKDSKTFGTWDSAQFSIDKPEALYAPKGVAMGMCTLSDDVLLLYKMDAPFVPAAARTIRWNDPSLNIPWPVDDPIMSDKDKNAPILKEFLSLEGAL